MDERERREKILKYDKDDNVNSLVWTASGKRSFASICSAEWINWDTLSAYGFSPSGILGFFGQEIKTGKYDLAFIIPLWIWQDSLM
jgi:hypothetical protein